MTTNLSYQVRKDVINHLKELIDRHFSLQPYESSESYPTPYTELHQSPSLQIISSSPDNKPYNQSPQQNYTILNPDELDASSHNQQGSEIQLYQQYQRSQDPYDVHKNNREFQSLKSSLGIINADLQRDFIEFKNIHAESENFYPFSYEIASSKLHDFQTIINLSNSIHDKTNKALLIIDQLLDNGFIDIETYDRHKKALNDGLSIFRDDFETATLDIFKGLVNAYHHQYKYNTYDQLKTLNALFTINKIIQEDNTILFGNDLQDICRSQFNEAIASFFKENFYIPFHLELYFGIHSSSEQKEFKKFMEEMARTQNQSAHFNQSQPYLSSISPYQVNQTNLSSYNPPSNSINSGNAQRVMERERQLHSPILSQSHRNKIDKILRPRNPTPYDQPNRFIRLNGR